jgi:hypothetical protein
MQLFWKLVMCGWWWLEIGAAAKQRVETRNSENITNPPLINGTKRYELEIVEFLRRSSC